MQQHRNFLFLCARPSFLEGLARIMDFGQTLNEYNSSPSAQEADFAAIAEDWAMIEQDFRDAIGKFETMEDDNLTSYKQVNE